MRRIPHAHVPGEEAPADGTHAHGLTEREPAELALRESERRASRLNAVLSGIARIFREALTCATEEELGKVCLAVAEEVTQSKFGYIDEINPQTGKLDAIAISDPGWDVCRMDDKSGHGQRVPSGFSITGLHGLVLREGAPLISNAPSSHPGRCGIPEGHPPLTAFLGVPLQRGGEAIGLIGLGNREGGYGQDELEAVEALAPAIVQAFLSKRAEARLRRSHEEYRHVVESSGSVILRVDKDMRISFVNQYGLRFFGYRAEELIGHRAVGTIVPLREESGRDTSAMAEDILRTPEAYRQNVHQNLRKDGSLVWMSWTNTPIYDDAGELVEILAIGNDLSELKEAEAALRRTAAQLQESEARYRTLVELAPDAVLVHQDRRIVFANVEALRLCGAASVDQLLGREVFELVAPEDRAALADRAERAEAGHPAPPREYRLRTFDGRYVPVESRASGILFQSRRAVQVVLRDVTERKRAEEALHETEARVHSITNNLPDTVIYQMEARPDGARRFAYLSDGVAGLLGCTPAEALADASVLYDKFLPEDRPLLAEREQEALTALAPFRIEARVRKPSGEVGWIHAASAPRRRDDASVVWDGVIMDITERKRADEERERLLAEVRVERDRISALVASMQDEVWYADAQRRFKLMNPAAMKAFALSAEDAGSVEAFAAGLEVLRPDGSPRPAQESPMLRALTGEVLSDVEEYVRTPATGELRFRQASATPVRDEAGQIVGAVAVVRDLTERKRAEEALRDANLQLAEVDRRKNAFLAILSHELRNPLAPITNSLYILDHAPAGGDQANRAREVIGRQIGQLSRLVNELLDVTRITNGKVQLQRERLELNEVVRRAVEDDRSSFDRVGVSLEFVPAPRPVPVIADGARVAQVVGNLLQNAAKFTSRGGWARVLVGVEAGEAVVRVEDNGVGVARAILERLFEPFIQAEQALDRSKGGLGLGLALVKGIVELHGGTVEAHSEGVGHGTQIVVRLPLDTSAPREAEPVRPRAPRPRRRVLVIEDNADAAHSLSEALALGEHEVAVAYDGPGGIAKARALHPDVVLCDIGLPGMDGYAVARAFRADEELRGTFLVALSGYALPEDLRRAADAGFDRHLANPPSLDKLEQLLEAASSR